MERRGLLGRVADLLTGSRAVGLWRRGRGRSSEIARPRSDAEHNGARAMLDADSIRALRDELDQLSPESLLHRARWLNDDGPPMHPELKQLREKKLHVIEQALHGHRHDERTSALNALREFCFNEELRRRAGG